MPKGRAPLVAIPELAFLTILDSAKNVAPYVMRMEFVEQRRSDQAIFQHLTIHAGCWPETRRCALSYASAHTMAIPTISMARYQIYAPVRRTWYLTLEEQTTLIARAIAFFRPPDGSFCS